MLLGVISYVLMAERLMSSVESVLYIVLTFEALYRRSG